MTEDVKVPETPVAVATPEAPVSIAEFHKIGISAALASAGHVTKDVADKVGHSVVEAILALGKVGK